MRLSAIPWQVGSGEWRVAPAQISLIAAHVQATNWQVQKVRLLGTIAHANYPVSRRIDEPIDKAVIEASEN